MPIRTKEVSMGSSLLLLAFFAADGLPSTSAETAMRMTAVQTDDAREQARRRADVQMQLKLERASALRELSPEGRAWLTEAVHQFIRTVPAGVVADLRKIDPDRDCR